MFKKLRIEQKFIPIYSPQCNGRIEGFHKFLKATIAKQLETRMEWDDLVWKATAAFNFFPTESSGIAPFFLMFGREAAVKHTLLESENPKYLGTNDGMINVGLMTKLYNVVAHNLNKARKARDGKKKGTTPKEPERLKIGNNILVRDHTSKAFQLKHQGFPQNSNASNNNSDQYDRSYQPQWTSPIKQYKYTKPSRHAKTQ